LFDLAPGGVYLAAHVPMNTGGLLHHPFTFASSGIAGKSCFLSVALSVPCEYRDPPLQRRLFLRSSDFPPRHWRGDHFTNLNYLLFCSIPEQHNAAAWTRNNFNTFLNFDNRLGRKLAVASTTSLSNNTYHAHPCTALSNSFIII
ncbi:uncharacterized protein METZ01_LOCUS505108, partial [marine metagenome]